MNNSNLKQILIQTLESSLDAALLIQGDEEGKVVFGNEAAKKLFGTTDELQATTTTVDSCIVSFSNKREADNNAVKTWKDVLEYYKDGSSQEQQPDKEWIITGRTASSSLLFHGTLKLSVFTDNNNEPPLYYYCAFIQVQQQQQSDESSQNNSMVEASLDPMFQVDQDGMIHTVNQAAVNLFGYSREELLWKNISILCGGNHAHQHDTYMQQYLQTGVKKVIGKRRELPARRKDGTEFWMELAVVELLRKESDSSSCRMFCGFVHDLSSRKRHEALIRGSIDTSLDPFFQINQDGVIEMMNAAAERVLGWTRQELLGANISILCGGGHAEHHHEYLQRYLKTGESRVIGKKRELLAKRKDGSEFWMELSLAELKMQDGDMRRFCGFIRDLTQQKQYEMEIRRREQFTSKIIEACPNSLFVVGTDGKIVRVNNAAISRFGWSAEEMVGESIRKVLAPKDADLLLKEIEASLSMGMPVTEKREAEGMTKAGSNFPLSLNTVEVKGPEDETVFAIYAEDLTDKKQRMQAEIEKAAAEVLLFNVLPEHIAAKLKADPSHIAESHHCATVLFADIVGFTSMSNSMQPTEVVSMLNELFSMFDDLVEQYHPLTKIKTIGDCYMATIVPVTKEEEEEDVAAKYCAIVCHFALDMIEALGKYNERNSGQPLNLRVGINCGEVVAGVVGSKRFLYDLWGDAVNVASRMESTGVPGKIQITPNVAKLLKDDFEMETRGMVQVKGIGEMETYFLAGRNVQSPAKPALPKKAKKGESEYTLLMDDNTKMDFGRSMRILSMSTRNFGQTLADEDDVDDDEQGDDGFESFKKNELTRSEMLESLRELK